MSDLIFSEENLKGIFGNFTCNKTTEEWILELACFHGKSCEIIINKARISELINKSQKYKLEKFSLYNSSGMIPDSTFEHIVRVVYEHPSLQMKPYYSLGYDIYVESPSEIYSLFLYLSNPLNSLSSEAQMQLIWMLGEKFDGKKVDFWKVISLLNDEILGIKSLNVRSNIHVTNDILNKLATSYIFNCSYRKNAIITMKSLFKELRALHPNENCYSSKIFSLDINQEFLHNYQTAIEINDPFISFISFYQIFEYFFKIVEHEFKKDIKLPSSSPFMGSSEDLKNLYQCRLNEETLLELVFRKFIDPRVLKLELNCIKRDYYVYLENNKVDFAEADEIKDNDFYRTLTKRVYKTRNAVVHRKEWKKPKYLPFEQKHKEELRNELLFMKTLANHIIIQSSNKFR